MGEGAEETKREGTCVDLVGFGWVCGQNETIVNEGGRGAEGERDKRGRQRGMGEDAAGRDAVGVEFEVVVGGKGDECAGD